MNKLIIKCFSFVSFFFIFVKDQIKSLAVGNKTKAVGFSLNYCHARVLAFTKNQNHTLAYMIFLFFFLIFKIYTFSPKTNTQASQTCVDLFRKLPTTFQTRVPSLSNIKVS